MLCSLEAERQTHPQTSRAGSELCKAAMCEFVQLRVSFVLHCPVSFAFWKPFHTFSARQFSGV